MKCLVISIPWSFPNFLSFSNALLFHCFFTENFTFPSKDISKEVANEKIVDMVERKRRMLPTDTQSRTSELTEVQGMCTFPSKF